MLEFTALAELMVHNLVYAPKTFRHHVNNNIFF